MKKHETSSNSEPKYHIHLFSEQGEQAGVIKANLNEHIFEGLQLQEIIEDSCTFGKDLTIFSLEGSGKKNGLSKIFNGNIKVKNGERQVVQQDSISKPGMIRITIESIFSHIFS